MIANITKEEENFKEIEMSVEGATLKIIEEEIKI